MKKSSPEIGLPNAAPAPSKKSRFSRIKKRSVLKNNPEAKPSEANESAKRSKLTPGGRNLVILGIASTLIAIITTSIGLMIYHLSGDIYLDRSRPGYLPDEAEVEEEAESEPAEFNFDKSGKLSKDQLDEYLDHLKEEVNAVDNYKDPFSASALSDERLDLPKDE